MTQEYQFAQLRPKPAGRPMRYVQFLGDPAVHPMIFSSNDPRPHFRLRRADEICGSSWLNYGDYIVWDDNQNIYVVSSQVFERDWQEMEETQDVNSCA